MNAGPSRLLWTLLRYLLTAAVLVWVGWKLWQDRDSLARMWTHLHGGAWGWLVPAVLLLPLNLLLEVVKWKILLRPVYPGLGTAQGMGAILAGMAAGFLTPNRIGEYAGRILYLPEGARLPAVALTFLDRIAQMLVTLITGVLTLLLMTGLYGDLILQQVFQGSLWLGGLFMALNLVFGGIIIWLLVDPERPLRLLLRVYRGRWRTHLEQVDTALAQTQSAALRRVLWVSLLRYLVFSTQYLLLLYAAGWTGGILLGYGLVILVFLGKSLFPYFGLGELGVREGVAIAVMSPFGFPETAAFSAAFLLYLLNIILPTLTGLVFLQRIRLKGGAA